MRLAHASVRFRGGCERILFGNSRDADLPSDSDCPQPTSLRVCLIEHLVLVDILGKLHPFHHNCSSTNCHLSVNDDRSILRGFD